MDTSKLSKGSRARLKRIQELKNCSELDALEYCVSIGWYTTEKRYDRPARGNHLAIVKKKPDTQ